MSGVHLRGIEKRFGGHAALRGIDLEVPDGCFFSLLGPSGCGKTTALRIVAGLEDPDAGVVEIGDRKMFDAAQKVRVPPEQRGLGMVFQTYAVWPHMNVEANIEFPLRVRGVKRAERRSRVAEMLDTVGLQGLDGRLPRELSGGQQQRVALARALIASPSVLLLDEPLSNLDARLRLKMREELRDLHERIAVTVLYVTHDQDEAFALSDQVAVLNDGEVLQVAPPRELRESPAHPFVAEFLATPESPR